MEIRTEVFFGILLITFLVGMLAMFFILDFAIKVYERNEKKPKKPKVKLKEFKEEFDDFKNDVIGKLQDNDKFNDNLAKRDMLVKTNFLGKLKNKELINSFKTLTRFRNKNPYACAFDMIEFEDVKQMVTDYDFEYLDDFLDMLKEYEDKQEVLDNFETNKNK